MALPGFDDNAIIKKKKKKRNKNKIEFFVKLLIQVHRNEDYAILQ